MLSTPAANTTHPFFQPLLKQTTTTATTKALSTTEQQSFDVDCLKYRLKVLKVSVGVHRMQEDVCERVSQWQ